MRHGYPGNSKFGQMQGEEPNVGRAAPDMVGIAHPATSMSSPAIFLIGHDMTATAHWEHFPHDADVGVRGLGATLEQAFEQAALALTAVITDPADVAAKEILQLSCIAPDAELLLVDWLNVLIYEMATRNMLFSRFEVHLEDS